MLPAKITSLISILLFLVACNPSQTELKFSPGNVLSSSGIDESQPNGSTLTGPPLPVSILSPIQTTSNTATINWEVLSDSSAPSSYEVIYATNELLSNSQKQISNQTNITLSGLQPGTTYYYQVKAINSYGQSISEVNTFQTLLLAPGAPINLTSTNTGINQVQLQWAPNPNAGLPSHYLVKHSTLANLSGVQPTQVNQTFLTLNNLQPFTTYFYEVTAVFPNGNSGTTHQFTTPQLIPGAPQIPNPSTQSTTTSSTIVKWSHPTGNSGGSVDSYKIQLSTSTSFPSANFSDIDALSSETQKLILGLTPGTTYYFRVLSVNTIGQTPSVTSSFITNNITVGAPSNLSINPLSQNSATIRWNAPTNGAMPTSYQITYSTNANFSNSVPPQTVQSTILSINAPFANQPALQPNTTYFYKVSAVYPNNNIIPAESSFQTLPAPPGQPLNLTNTPTHNQVTVSWQAPSSGGAVASYRLELLNQNNVIIKTVAGLSPNTTSNNVDHVLLPNTDYKSRVFAINSSGETSVTQNFITLIAPPNPPTNLSFSNPSSDGITINWSAPNSGGGAISSYTVSVFTQNNNLVVSYPGILPTITSKIVTGLSASTTYKGRVTSINTSGQAQVESNFTTSTPPPPPPPPSGEIDFNLELLVADRRLISSILEEVFGTSAATVSTINNFVYEKAASYGGGCDRYALVYINHGYIAEFHKERCFDNIGIINKTNPIASRYAYTMKVCQALVNYSDSMNTVNNKIFGSSNPGPVTNNNLITAYQLFYPEETPPANVLTALTNLGAIQSSNSDKWKTIIYTLCSDPRWQTL